ncbi:MAG: hypothetical protein NC541_13695 [bacterium]|nr:hypothetical protein [bacterium]
MVKKLTVKAWISTGFVILGCLIIAVPILWMNAPGALAALQGRVPQGADERTVTNFYGLTAIGLFMVVIVVVIFFRQLSQSVKKRVGEYLAKHGGVTEDQLDRDFESARQIGKVWIGKRWTFSHDLRPVLVENEAVAWVFSEKEHVKNKVNYYICLGLADGTVERVCVSEEQIREIMEAYKTFPHILSGNNPEYAYLYKSDREAFLEMKYRQNINIS